MLFCFCFRATPDSAQHSLLALLSGILLVGFRRLYVVSGIEPGLSKCKASIIPMEISLWPGTEYVLVLRSYMGPALRSLGWLTAAWCPFHYSDSQLGWNPSMTIPAGSQVESANKIRSPEIYYGRASHTFLRSDSLYPKSLNSSPFTPRFLYAREVPASIPRSHPSLIVLIVAE